MLKTILFSLIVVAVALPADGVPAIADTVLVRDWLLAGPFPIGVREGITGLIMDPETFRPVPGETLRSGLVRGGHTTWRRVEADSAGGLETGYEGVAWDTVRNYYGIAGLMSAGYAWAELELPRRSRALAVSARCGFSINGRSYQGNPYGDPWQATPVLLDSGPNRILLSLSGFGDTRARFLLVPPAAPVMVIGADLTAPDPEPGAGPVWLGVPLLNTTAEYADRVGLRLLARVADGPDPDSFAVVADTVINRLPPLGVLKPPLQARLPAPGPVELVLEASFAGAVHRDTVRLPARKHDEPRRVTFRSGIDNSCQYYAVLYPENYDPNRRYPVIFTLHGAGVEARGQAAAYRAKDWAFVVAPTNRRPYGFDWQDWGRLDAVEVLDTILRRLPIDPDRVLLTGGSMGGHGCWHVGLTHPDRFAVAAPQAGWPTHQLYVPWFLQRAAIFARPGQLAVRDRALRPDNVPAMLGNALNLPFFILHGGDDDNVPPLHARNLAAWLDELGSEFVLRELPGRGHWWTDDSLGITVCDDTALMNYIRDRKRVTGPRHIRFRTADLGTAQRAWWAALERVRTVGEDAELEAWALDSLVRVRTVNLAQFRLDLDARLPFDGPVAIEIDGREVSTVRTLPAYLQFHFRGGRWRSGPARTRASAKTPSRYGPAKQAMFRPFLLVYGTADPAQAERLRHEAVQEGMRWWVRANGRAEVLADTAVTDSLAARYNLVLYGGQDANAVTRRLAGRLPVQVRENALYLDGRELGPDLAAMFVYPNPDHPERLVLVRMGTDPEHTRLAGFFGLLYSGAGVPDFIIFDRSVRRLGWAGVRAAGFFGPDWGFDPGSAWLAE